MLEFVALLTQVWAAFLPLWTSVEPLWLSFWSLVALLTSEFT